jgi:hypothetical protein
MISEFLSSIVFEIKMDLASPSKVKTSAGKNNERKIHEKKSSLLNTKNR